MFQPVDLRLSNNEFSGEVSNVFKGLNKLEVVMLGNNDLSGKLPSNLMGLPNCGT